MPAGLGIPSVFGSSTEAFVRQAYIDARDIERLAASVRTFRVPLERSLNQVVIPAIQKNFDAEGRPKWAPLSAETLLTRKTDKKTVGRQVKILDRTGFLKRVATQKNLWDVKDDQLLLRSVYFSQRVKYSSFHQTGTRNMPQRVFMSLAGDDVEKVEEVFDEWLGERIRHFWGRGF